MRILCALLVMSLTACADWQEDIYNLGVTAERSMSGLEKLSLTTAGHDWIYLDSAPGNPEKLPTVLMLHGFAVDKDNWIRFARDFDDYRVIVPDLPGHGETSYNPDLTYDFANQAVWLESFVAALNLESFHLMGNSMGGGISAMYAHAHPEQIKTITLIDAAGVYPPTPSKLQQILDSNGDNPLIIQKESDFDRLREFALEDGPFLPWPAPGVLARQAMARQDINSKIFADIHAVAEAAKHSDEHLTMLEEINQPVLILWGKEDRALDVSSVQVFEQYLPNSRSFIFEGVGHAPMLERPSESAELVLGFLSGKGESLELAAE